MSVDVTYPDGQRLVERTRTGSDGTQWRESHQFPDALTHHYLPGEPGEPIPLYEGTFRLDDRDWNGTVALRWYPSPRAVASGHAPADLERLMESFQDAGVRQWVALPEIMLLNADDAVPSQPTAWTDGPEPRVGDNICEAALAPQAIGDPHGLDRITFLIPNGWDVDRGTAICDPDSPETYWYGRVITTTADWQITLDCRPGTNKDFFRSLRTSNASAVTHVGELRRTDGHPFDAEDATAALDALRLALTIATGRTIYLLLPVGWQAETPVWTRWTSPHIDGVKNVGTFLDRHEGVVQLSELIERVLTYCTTPQRTDAIRYASSYYVTATYDVDVELGVALPVSGLQSLAYYRFVEQRRTHTRRQWKALPNTEAEIRLLLDDCHIPTSLAPSLAH